MARIGRTLRGVLIAGAVLVVVLVVLLIVLTRTDFGVERAGQFAVERLRSAVNGELRVGRVASGGILRGATLHDVAIDDPDGRPFLRADSARLSYHLWTLIGGEVSFDRLTLYGPDVVIERLPGQEQWNYQRVFPGDTTAAPDTAAASGLVLIDDVTVHDGRATIRLPWEPEGPVEADDTARLILEEVPGGIARVVRLEDLEGRIPRIIWESPDVEGRVIRVGALEGRVFVWETPIELRGLEGTITLRDSLVSFVAPSVRLPSSELEIVGQIIIDDEGNLYDVEVSGDDLAFADFQWLYPSLPEEGGGSLLFRMQSQDANNILWLAQDARLRTGGTEMAGSFGVVTGDTLYFTNVALEASPLDLELLQSLLPGDLPLDGLLIGTVEVDGPISSLQTRGDLRYRRLAGGRTTESALRWDGRVQGRRPFTVSGLNADLRGVDLEQLAAVLPGLRLRGIATGRVRADGSLTEGLRLTGELAMDRDGQRSIVRGGGDLAVGGDRSRFDIRMDAAPLALELIAEQVPALARLTGQATGPVTITGSLDDLRIEADITTAAGGIALNGVFAFSGETPRYTAEGAVTDFLLHEVVDGIPATTLTARFDVDGAGARPEDLAGDLELNVSSAQVDGIPVHGGQIRVSARNGFLRVDTVDVQTRVGDLAAAGTFGLVPGADGELRFALRADTLAPLERHLVPPRIEPDTAMFPAARLAGTVTAEGAVRGSLERWTLSAQGRVRNGVYDQVRARRLDAIAEWTPGEDRIALTGSVDSVAVGDRFVPRGRIEGRYAGGEGAVALEVHGPGAERLDGAGEFTRLRDGFAFDVHRLTVATRHGPWELGDTVSGRAGRTGFSVEPMVLSRAGDDARIELSGVLPWSDPEAGRVAGAAFNARIENVRIGELLRLAQMDTLIDGAVTGRIGVTGTALAPIIEGGAVARGFRYDEATLDSLSADIRYSGRVLTGRVAGWQGAEEIITGGGRVPLDLALADIEARRLDRDMEVIIAADSVPAGLVSFLAPGFSRVAGRLDGSLVIEGTPRAPRLLGELRISNGSGYFEHSGVHYRQVTAVAGMRDTQLLIEGTLRTSSGSGEIRGTMNIEDPGDPVFDLELVARQLDAARRRDVVAVADGRVRLTGRYSAPVVSGAVRLTEGELNLGEILRQYRIVQLEPWFYEVLDTTSLDFRPPQQTPFLANLRVRNTTVLVERGFWLRGPELDVEVSGELALIYDRAAEDLRMSGALQAVRGTYEMKVVPQLPGRRFDIRGGTIDFVGTPGIDPNLDIAATYRLRRAQGEAIDVVANVAGTLQEPRVALTSETDLPISESDLASYIIFGRSTAELSQAESDVLASNVGTTGAFGQIQRNVLGAALGAVVAPTVFGLATSGLQSFLPLDYVALSAPAEDFEFLQDAQIEVGKYAVRNDRVGDIFLATTVRRPRGANGETGGLNLKFGGRMEWRFRPTWTFEFYVEDRFARTPSFGLQEIENRTVGGLTLFREWAY